MENRSQKFESVLNVRLLLIFLAAFAVVSAVFEQFTLAAMEGAITLLLAIYAFISNRRHKKALEKYIESVAYDSETAQNRTLQNFPLPIAVFRITDNSIVWANQNFFDACSVSGNKIDNKMDAMVRGFSSKWLVEGKNQCPGTVEINNRLYQVNGNLVRPEKENGSYMGITYWVDVTDYENIRSEYEKSRPVIAEIVHDNYDEMTKGQPNRITSDIRDEVEDAISNWCANYNGLLKSISKDKYLFIFEEQYMEKIIKGKFSLLEDAHKITNPSGIHATISIGIGRDGAGYDENLQFAGLAMEMALSRGGDQAVTKNRFNFDFYGGKRGSVETRTKVKSRVMANALYELIGNATQVYAMGHIRPDNDAIGACAAVCCIARKCGVKANIVVEEDKTHAKQLIELLKRDDNYKDIFIDTQEAMLKADNKTLMVLVDTNRPEQALDPNLLEAINHVAVIDHHRRAATYVNGAVLSYIEPYASSACELMSEILQEVTDPVDILQVEAEAMMAGIVLDTKSFNIRTGERTFDAAAFLRRAGADTSDVKRIMQLDMEDTIKKAKLLQSVKMYKNIAIGTPEEDQDRVVAAQAADELLNVAGVEASIILYPRHKEIFASARSIGDINVQLIMEKMGGGGNRNAAAAQLGKVSMDSAEKELYKVLDEYFEDDNDTNDNKVKGK